MSKPYQFIGYWGIGSQDKLELIFTKVLNAVSNWGKPQPLGWLTKRGPTEGNCMWGVSYISIDETPPTVADSQNIIASVSASGLSNAPDAWVKVEKNSLILGREPFGHFPLYWMQLEQFIWFASQLQLLLLITKTPQVSIPALYGYSCFSYVPTPLTPVEGISAVSPGTEQVCQCIEKWHGASLQVAPQTPRRWHQWRSAPVLIKEEGAATAQLQSLLKNAVDRQLENLPSEPVGVLLSGGLDSSTVASLLVQAGVKVRAYTLDFGATAIPESPYAQQVADFLKIPLVKVEVTPRRMRKAIESTAAALDLPFGDGVTVPLYLLYQAASQETAVIFNGEGGDQLFAGWTNKPLIAASVYNAQQPAGAEDLTQQYLQTFHRLYGYEARVFSSAVYAKIAGDDGIAPLNPAQWLQEALDPSFSSGLLDRLRRATLMLKGSQNIHPRATNLALAHGLVVRSPFCDLPLAEWTFQLPGELFLQGACEKYILKRAVESWLPAEIVWRQKRGMGVPLTQWFLKKLRFEVGYWLNPGILRQEGRWLPDLAKQVILGELGGQIQGRRIGEILWLLIMWQAWRTKVLLEVAKGRTIVDSLWLLVHKSGSSQD
ncbi:MAG: asparagine synthase [Symploca sp. SIO3C6]|nr:asparagine synthase [Symploca sp. SIO3C6]